MWFEKEPWYGDEVPTRKNQIWKSSKGNQVRKGTSQKILWMVRIGTHNYLSYLERFERELMHHLLKFLLLQIHPFLSTHRLVHLYPTTFVRTFHEYLNTRPYHDGYNTQRMLNHKPHLHHKLLYWFYFQPIRYQHSLVNILTNPFLFRPYKEVHIYEVSLHQLRLVPKLAIW
eukprot:COSAG06_NODE_495_length_15047_cov_11.349478_13_plen_172_part_00